MSLSEYVNILPAPGNGWNYFPSTAPRSGLPIVVGGITSDGKWIDIIARYNIFASQDVTIDNPNLSSEWIVHGYVTLENFTDQVTWMYWHHRPQPPDIQATWRG